ncbi:MAG: hypothetical protein JNG84_05265 [Archangium sp.]|nr:hypothetical protein [Archangium sp.]
MRTQQFTVRNVSASVGRALRQLAQRRQVSLNRVLVDALEAATGVKAEPTRHHDLDALSGTWVDDPAVDRALADQRRVDPRDWK